MWTPGYLERSINYVYVYMVSRHNLGVQCQDIDRTMFAIPARLSVNQLYRTCVSTSYNEVRAKL